MHHGENHDPVHLVDIEDSVRKSPNQDSSNRSVNLGSAMGQGSYLFNSLVNRFQELLAQARSLQLVPFHCSRQLNSRPESENHIRSDGWMRLHDAWLPPSSPESCHQFIAHLLPWNHCGGVSAMFGQTPIEFFDQRRRKWHSQIRIFLCDGVPKLLNRFESLLDRQPTQMLQIHSSLRHGAMCAVAWQGANPKTAAGIRVATTQHSELRRIRRTYIHVSPIDPGGLG
jgi:hypothetical protein